MARLFGTDGVRGLANGDVLTPELALAVARSAAHELLRLRTGAGRPLAVIGRDTRPSGPMLEAAAAAGFASAGVDVLLLGVVPTPVVAHACAHGGADLGLVVSASHNPMPDNGLKLFGPGGWKLPDEVEVALERGLGDVRERPTGLDLGRITSGTQVVAALRRQPARRPAGAGRGAEGRRRLRAGRGVRPGPRGLPAGGRGGRRHRGGR